LRVAAAAAIAFAAATALFYWLPSGAPGNATSPVQAPPPAIQAAPAPAGEPAPQAAPTAADTQLSTATTEPAPVRFANPFDSSEVFEFPPGTSYVEARDRVARVLIARARERNTSAPPPRKTTATARPERSARPESVVREASFARQL
jgi:hypothetical protein